MTQCIFDNNIDCKHFINEEHRCFIFSQRCDSLKYKMEFGINQFGDIVSLIFKQQQIEADIKI